MIYVTVTIIVVLLRTSPPGATTGAAQPGHGVHGLYYIIPQRVTVGHQGGVDLKAGVRKLKKPFSVFLLHSVTHHLSHGPALGVLSAIGRQISYIPV